MKLVTVITAPAQIDITEAVQWYEEQSRSLGLRFWIELKRVIQRVKNFPEAYPAVGRRQVRKARMATFPYGVYYRCVGEELRILAVIHPARDPKFVRSRIT